jgi:NAD/NADP transhydrogenase alpha subunit
LRTVAGTVVGVPKELEGDERRVAQTPETVKELVKKGFSVRFGRSTSPPTSCGVGVWPPAAGRAFFPQRRNPARGAPPLPPPPPLPHPLLSSPPPPRPPLHPFPPPLPRQVIVQSGAGAGSTIPDSAFAAAGAKIVPDAATVYKDAHVVLKVRAPSEAEVASMQPESLLVSFVYAARNPSLVKALEARGVTSMAYELVPRTTKGQAMDALSAMANIAGYRAVVEAGHLFNRILGGQITAAGKVAPSKILIIGGGVAGLAAAAQARAMGAIVRIFDTRAAVEEQAKSLGADFLKVNVQESGDGGGGYAKEMSEAYKAAQAELFAKQCKEVDIIITTALIPGKPAPKLFSKAMVDSMKPGSVIMDLAAEAGGNCELTVPGKVRGRSPAPPFFNRHPCAPRPQR